MLEIDHDFISHIVRNGNLEEVLESGVKETDFVGDGRKYFRCIADHHSNYGTVPDRKTFRALTKRSITKLGEGKQPLKFYLDRILERRCQLVVIEHDQKVKACVQKADWRGAADVIYQTATKIIAQPASSGEEDTITFGDLSAERLDRFRQARKSEDGITGFRFPWHSLNLMAGGFRLTDMVMFAGETGIGKSWLLCAIAHCLLNQELRVLVVPKEMPSLDFSIRLACVAGGFDHSKVIMGRLSSLERKRYLKFEKTMSANLDLHFVKPGHVNNCRELRKQVQKIKPHAFLVDGMYLLAENSKAPLHERVSESSTQCRNVALDEGVLGIGTGQLVLDKKSEKEGYSFADLAHAKGQARDATHLYFLIRNNKLEIQRRAWLLCLKTRQGTKKHVEISWDIDGADFSELKEIQTSSMRIGKKMDWGRDSKDEEVTF